VVTSGLPYVGVRIPNHPLAQVLLKKLHFPLAAPSANPFGYISPTTPHHVNDQLGEHIPYILSGGKCKVGIESTIISFEQDRPIIYRLGGITTTAIEKIIGPVIISLHHTPDHPKTSGTLATHYAPNKQLLLGNIHNLIQQNSHQRIGILAFNQYYSAINQELQVILSSTGNLNEAAAHLFEALRKLDQLPIDIILSNFVPRIGMGLAINDRLTRASKRIGTPNPHLIG
jgi:L-threonylcarbamoyladenylate synthase